MPNNGGGAGSKRAQLPDLQCIHARKVPRSVKVETTFGIATAKPRFFSFGEMKVGPTDVQKSGLLHPEIEEANKNARKTERHHSKTVYRQAVARRPDIGSRGGTRRQVPRSQATLGDHLQERTARTDGCGRSPAFRVYLQRDDRTGL